MKFDITAVLLLSTLLANAAMDQQSWDTWPAVVTSSTNVDGSVLRLEFAAKEVIAGDRLFGRMVVSNASTEFRQLRYDMTKRRDSYIGDFVVVDDKGNEVLKTIWSSLEVEKLWSKGRIASLWPSNSAAFKADLIGHYSLTNPSTYFVKAVAQIPTSEREPEDVVIETPPVAITVLPRPEGAPPPEPLYTAAELARVPKDEAPPQLQVTPPRPRAGPPGANTQARPVIAAPTAGAQASQDGASVAGTAKVDDPAASPSATPSRTRTMVYASIVVFALLLLGAILWQARRKEHTP